MARILVVTADAELRALLRFALDRADHEAILAVGVQAALALLHNDLPRASIIATRLPDGSGLDLARRVRAESMLPIILIGTDGGDSAYIEAIDAGADGYLSIPFNMTILLKRLEALLRRAEMAAALARSDHVEIGGVRVALAVDRLDVAGQSTHLTPTEARLLRALLSHRGRPIAARTLATWLWGDGTRVTRIKSHMHHLRRKLNHLGSEESIIETVPGVGYRLQ